MRRSPRSLSSVVMSLAVLGWLRWLLSPPAGGQPLVVQCSDFPSQSWGSRTSCKDQTLQMESSWR